MPEPIPKADYRRLATIATYSDHVQANIARNVLDSEGIPACLGAENAGTLLTYYGTAIGGVKLLVFADQAEQAKALLGARSAADFVPDANAFEDEKDDDQTLELRERESQISRAWSAAVLGLVVCPPLLNIYSMRLLIRHDLMRTNHGPWRDWRINSSLLLNLLSICVLSWLIWSTMNIQSPFFLWHE